MVITFSESLFISYEHIIIQPIDTNAPRVDSFKKMCTLSAGNFNTDYIIYMYTLPIPINNCYPQNFDMVLFTDAMLKYHRRLIIENLRTPKVYAVLC